MSSECREWKSRQISTCEIYFICPSNPLRKLSELWEAKLRRCCLLAGWMSKHTESVVSVASQFVLKQPRVQVKILLDFPPPSSAIRSFSVRQTKFARRAYFVCTICESLILLLCGFLRMSAPAFCLCCAASHVNLSRVCLSTSRRVAIRNSS